MSNFAWLLVAFGLVCVGGAVVWLYYSRIKNVKGAVEEAGKIIKDSVKK